MGFNVAEDRQTLDCVQLDHRLESDGRFLDASSDRTQVDSASRVCLPKLNETLIRRIVLLIDVLGVDCSVATTRIKFVNFHACSVPPYVEIPF